MAAAPDVRQGPEKTGAHPLGPDPSGFERQPVGDPVVERLRAQLPVEAPRGRVPVEDDPLHPAAALAPGLAMQLRKEHAPEAQAPVIRMHEDVFQVQRRPGQKAAVGEQVDRVADGLAVDLGHQDPDAGADVADQAPRRRGRDRGELLVAREGPDQADQGFRVALLVGPDLHSLILKRSDDWRNSSATRSPNFLRSSSSTILVNGSTGSGRPWTPIQSLSKRGPSGT